MLKCTLGFRHHLHSISNSSLQRQVLACSKFKVSFSNISRFGRTEIQRGGQSEGGSLERDALLGRSIWPLCLTPTYLTHETGGQTALSVILSITDARAFRSSLNAHQVHPRGSGSALCRGPEQGEKASTLLIGRKMSLKEFKALRLTCLQSLFSWPILPLLPGWRKTPL